MQVNNSINREESQLAHCLARQMCPLGDLCATPDATSGTPLCPMVASLDPGEELWPDARFEQRAFIIQEGVFACIPNPEDPDIRAVAALYGPGDSFGLAELYSERDIATMYRMQALTAARVCSIPARVLRKRIEALPPPQAQQVMASTFMNTSCSMYYQSRIMAKTKATDRVLMLLGRIAQLARRSDPGFSKVPLGQAGLALLAGSERMCVGRALRHLEEEGLIHLGYRSIELLDAFFACQHPELKSLSGFKVPKRPGKMEA